MKRKLDAEDVPVPASAPIAGSEHVGTAFSAFGLDPRLQQAIMKEQFSTPTPVQSKAIPLALEGKDIFGRITLVVEGLTDYLLTIPACAKTGSGKTAAYVIPILESVLRRKTVG